MDLGRACIARIDAYTADRIASGNRDMLRRHLRLAAEGKLVEALRPEEDERDAGQRAAGA